MKPDIRIATPSDAGQMLAIYRPYVEETAVSFETRTPTVREFGERISSTLRRYPWLAAEADGRVIGYAYAGAFKNRGAYDWSVETSIYLERDLRGRGLGRALYAALEDILRRQGVRNLNACIACSDRADDPYLTDGSIRFHEKMGYEAVGRFDNCGFKLGRWYSMLWMQKMVGSHDQAPDPLIPFPELGGAPHVEGRGVTGRGKRV